MLKLLKKCQTVLFTVCVTHPGIISDVGGDNEVRGLTEGVKEVTQSLGDGFSTDLKEIKV